MTSRIYAKKAAVACLLGLCCWPMTNAYAWGIYGHRLVTDLAMSQLSSAQRHQVNHVLAGCPLLPQSARSAMAASAWPDVIKQQGVLQFNDWHYTNLPLLKTPRHSHINAGGRLLWALRHNLDILRNTHLGVCDHAFALAFVMHLVADAHQPLHCANIYSVDFPDGDNGGNRYLLPLARTPNLHRYWDMGAGLLLGKHRLTRQQLAKFWQNSTDDGVRAKCQDLDAQSWVQESYILAQTVVYTTPLNVRPSFNYQQRARVVVKNQLALAACRLAGVLRQQLPYLRE